MNRSNISYDFKELRPQIVILAPGAKPFLLPIEGKRTTWSSKLCIKSDVNISQAGNVAIIGGGSPVGMETAEYNSSSRSWKCKRYFN